MNNVEHASQLRDLLHAGDAACRASFAKYMAAHALLDQGLSEITPETTVGEMMDACLATWLGRIEAHSWAVGEADRLELLGEEFRRAA